MSEGVIIIIGWILCGLLGTLIQVKFQIPKVIKTEFIILIILGIIFGPINLLATLQEWRD